MITGVGIGVCVGVGVGGKGGVGTTGALLRKLVKPRATQPSVPSLRRTKSQSPFAFWPLTVSVVPSGNVRITPNTVAGPRRKLSALLVTLAWLAGRGVGVRVAVAAGPALVGVAVAAAVVAVVVGDGVSAVTV